MTTITTFLFIFLTSFCDAVDSNLILKHNDQTFSDDSYVHYDEIPKLDNTKVFGPNATIEFYVVLIFGLSTLQLNLFGSLYIIYRTYLQWKRGGRDNLSLSLRFPFYIALSDALLSLGYTINLSYTLIWKLPWPNPSCRLIGTSVVTLFSLNMFLVGIIAYTTWSRVCREICIEFGPYDYKLLAVMFALSAVVVAISMRNAGQQKYWCAGRHHNILVPIIMIVLIFMILAIILVCYIKVLLKIRKNEDFLLVSRNQRARIERRALRKLISYIFTFSLQFIPLLAYYFFSIASIEHVLLHVLAITSINFGGIGNFIQFIINEGLRYSAQSTSETSTEATEVKEITITEVKEIITEVKEVKEVKEDKGIKEVKGVKEDKEQNPLTNSIIPEKITCEVKDKIDINTNNNFGETASNLKSDVTIHLEDDENIIEIRKTNTDDVDIINNELKDDDVVFYDTLSIIDATTLVNSFNSHSSEVLLNHDDDFWQELDHYTGSYKKSF